jgi:hypothetical protein
MPALHPTLAALSLVLDEGGDLGSISRSNPKILGHKYYDEHAVFPENISELVSGDPEAQWWTRLGMSCLHIQLSS